MFDPREQIEAQIIALYESVKTFDYIPREALEAFLWEATIELWARHGIRERYPTGPSAYDHFCEWFPEFDIEKNLNKE